MNGWNKNYAARYPIGKGVRPAYSWWAGEKLTYIEAKKKIYIPLYSTAVKNSNSFTRLKKIYEINVEVLGEDLFLLDFDGYDHKELDMTYDDVINSKTRKMGHAFVLSMMLEGYVN